MFSFPSSALLAVTSGVAAHVLIWVRGEWDAIAGRILFAAIVIHSVLIYTIASYLSTAQAPFSYKSIHTELVQFETCHLIGVFSSTVFYRLFLHRLRHFPGPLGARIWIWWRVWKTFRSGERQAIVIDELHKKYGDVVRVGPNHLSISSASAVSIIHGSGPMSHSPKPATYLNPTNPGSVNAERDPVVHDMHRRKWDRALTSKGEVYVDDMWIPILLTHS